MVFYVGLKFIRCIWWLYFRQITIESAKKKKKNSYCDLHKWGKSQLERYFETKLRIQGKGRSDILFTLVIYDNICRHSVNVPDLNVADFTASQLPRSLSAKQLNLHLQEPIWWPVGYTDHPFFLIRRFLFGVRV